MALFRNCSLDRRFSYLSLGDTTKVSHLLKEAVMYGLWSWVLISAGVGLSFLLIPRFAQGFWPERVYRDRNWWIFKIIHFIGIWLAFSTMFLGLALTVGVGPTSENFWGITRPSLILNFVVVAFCLTIRPLFISDERSSGTHSDAEFPH